MTLPFLPYGRQKIDADDINAVTEVLQSPFLTSGPAVEKFEQKLGLAVQAQFTVSCSSGTAALHLAALALRLVPGDIVIVPTTTFLATANAVRYVGAEVVFSDVAPDTGLMQPEHFEDALARCTGPVKAVFPVHLAGQTCDMAGIAAIARKHNISIVEDASHALGSENPDSNGKISKVGSCAYSDMAIFSFHPVKTIATGEGGAITTNDPKLAQSLCSYRNHGMSRDEATFANTDMAFDTDGRANPWYYEMQEPGFNYRASDIHCALGSTQLDKLGLYSKKRQKLASLYDQALPTLAPTILPIRRMPGTPVWHLYVVLIDFAATGRSRACFMRDLHDKGIGSQVHYIPVHHQPYYRNRYGKITMPGADQYYERCLSLPLFPDMNDEDVFRVVEALSSIIHQSPTA